MRSARYIPFAYLDRSFGHIVLADSHLRLIGLNVLSHKFIPDIP